MVNIKQEKASFYTRDGVRLDADIYRPESSENFPILLMRQPYGRKIASTIVYAHPAWYASHGYIVVIQDVRGRGTSQGEFDLFANEIDDGLDTIHWLSQLSGSNGSIGMYGFSYQGMTQLYTAANRPPALKTLCPAMIAYDLYQDWAYENGAFCLQTNLAWAIQIAAETARLQGDSIAFQQLSAASRQLPLYDTLPANPRLLQELAVDSFYHDWLSHPYPDTYWEQLSPKTFLADVDLPMLHIGGWFDPYLRGTLNLYHAMKRQCTSPQYLIIGAWGHLPWSRTVGEIDYGKTAITPVDWLQLRWFDYFLKGEPSGILDEPSIRLFEMGSNQWRFWREFPNQSPKIFYLGSNGLANLGEEGILTPNSPYQISVAEDMIVHDPWRPVPALGGHCTIPSGAMERSPIDERSDVLTYTSEPLTTDLHLAGDITIQLYCQADALSFDLCAILSQVLPDGKVYNFSQGYIRVDSHQSPLTIPLQATCIKIPQGHCLRLSLSGACFPAYPVNPGTGSLPKNTRLIEAQIITLKLKSGEDFPSCLKLPVYFEREILK